MGEEKGEEVEKGQEEEEERETKSGIFGDRMYERRGEGI